MIRLAVFLVGLSATTAQAQVLDFPANAVLQTSEVSAFDSYDLPVAIWADGAIPTKPVEGEITRQAWRINTQALTTLQLLRPLRDQLRDDGYSIILDCQTEACGGFDFRFGTTTLLPPEMQINIGDFRFLAAERSTPDGDEYVSLFVSRTAQAGFVQLTRVGPARNTATDIAPPAGAAPVDAVAGDPPSGLGKQLDDSGRAVLADLEFAIGSSSLADRAFDSLAEIAAYLTRYPDRSIALVGHTDTLGALDTNIALSRQRAAAVVDRLVADYGVSRSRLAAEGMGYLAPVASNLTAEGRSANRRVEVIVTSAD